MGRTVLVVVGSDVVQGEVGRALMENGCRVIAAANVAQALKSLETEVPQLVLLEFAAGVPGAARFLNVLRAIPDREHLPVILLADKKDLPQARQLRPGHIIVHDEPIADKLIEIMQGLFPVCEAMEDAPRSMLF